MAIEDISLSISTKVSIGPGWDQTHEPWICTRTHYIDCATGPGLIQNFIFSSSISFNMYFGYSKELFYRDNSFGNLQHMFRLKNKKTIFNHTLLLSIGSKLQ